MSVASEAIAPDEAEVRRFVQAIHQAAETALSHVPAKRRGRLQVSRLHPASEKLVVIARYEIGDVERMIRDVMIEASEGHNVFVEGRTVRPDLKPNARGTGERDTVGVFALVVDNDADAGKGGGGLDLAPSLVVESSPGNDHRWFFLQRAVSYADARAIGERMRSAGGDAATGKPDQPYRIAGTPNLPSAKKQARGRVPVATRIIDEGFVGEDRISFEAVDFADLWPEARTAQQAEAVNIGETTVGIADLLARCSPTRLAQLADPNPINAKTGERDRSEHVHMVTGFLRGDGFSAAECLALWAAHPAGAAVSKWPNPDRLATEIARSYGKVSDRPIDLQAMQALAAHLTSGTAKASQISAFSPPAVEPYPMTWFADIDPNIHKEWTVEDVLGEGELILPYGAPGCGKSVLMGDMACHIGAGWKWFGKTVRQTAVLYVAAERASLVKRRFAAFRKHHEIDDLPVVVIEGYFDLAKAKRDTDRVIATVEGLRAATGLSVVVIIDTKRQVIGDENSDDMGAFVSNIARIQNDTKSGIVVIDHSPFHSPTKPSGRGELIAATDATFLVEKVGDLRTCRIVKVNDGSDDDFSIAFDLTSVSLGIHPSTGKVTTAPVVVSCDTPEPKEKSSGRLTNSEKIALAALEEAILEAGETMASGRVPSSAKAVSMSLWREYAYKRGITDADGTEARKKAFQRARQSLVTKHRIGTWDEHVWLLVQGTDISKLLASGGTRDITGTRAGHVPRA